MSMKAISQRAGQYKQTIKIREHQLIGDEPTDAGGDDAGPSPQELLAASLASCTAVTMEMYADRKGWELGEVEVDVDMDYGDTPAPRSFEVTLRIGADLSDDQLERLRVIAGKCPVHRLLAKEAEVTITDRVERVQ